MRTIVETSSNKPTNLPYPHPNVGELNILIRNWGWQLWGNPRGEWGEGGEGGNSVTYTETAWPSYGFSRASFEGITKLFPLYQRIGISSLHTDPLLIKCNKQFVYHPRWSTCLDNTAIVPVHFVAPQHLCIRTFLGWINEKSKCDHGKTWYDY